jgi:hypothetical protein
MSIADRVSCHVQVLDRHWSGISRCRADGIFQPQIDEIQAEHAQERVKQSANNLGWIAATPHCGKSEDADQIVKAALKALDLLGWMFGLHTHVRPPSGATQSLPASPFAKLAQELLRWYKERVLLEDAADDDHRMRTHDVDYRLASEFRKVVHADDRVVVTLR